MEPKPKTEIEELEETVAHFEKMWDEYGAEYGDRYIEASEALAAAVEKEKHDHV